MSEILTKINNGELTGVSGYFLILYSYFILEVTKKVYPGQPGQHG